jgi:hypothetical protein
MNRGQLISLAVRILLAALIIGAAAISHQH